MVSRKSTSCCLISSHSARTSPRMAAHLRGFVISISTWRPMPRPRHASDRAGWGGAPSTSGVDNDVCCDGSRLGLADL